MNLFGHFFRFQKIPISWSGSNHHKVRGLKYKFGVMWNYGNRPWFKERGGGMVCQGKKWKNSAILVGIGDHMHSSCYPHSPSYCWETHTGPLYFTRVSHFLPWIKKVLVIHFK